MKKIKKLLAFVVVLALALTSVIALVACTTPHECGHKCTVDGCNKCTSDCTDPACKDKCPGHGTTPPAPHTCTSKCTVDGCGLCTNQSCNDDACKIKCGGHNTHAPTSKWWIDTTTGTLTENGTDYLASVTLKTTPVSFSYANTYAADAAHAYIAVKYSGTATFHEISIYGTKEGGESKSGVVAAVAGNGWNVTNTLGSDFSVVVAQIGGYYGAGELNIDTITNIGFTVTGEAGDTIIIHDFELLPNANHNFGTPTPPVVEGDLEIGDMAPGWDGNGFTVTKDGDDQTVSFSTSRGYEKVVVEVKNYTSEYKYLCIDFTASHNMTIGVWKGSQLSNGHEAVAAGRKVMVIDVSNKALPASFILEFYFDAGLAAGTEYSEIRTVVFHSVEFSKIDPNASSEANHFRTPVGKDGVTYSEADGKITYTNTKTDYYRSLEILLDNHDTDYDVLSLKLTGYNGLRLGVRVLYTYEVEAEGEKQTVESYSDLIYSGAYYSLIETAAQTEFVFYLGAYDLQGKTITGVQLYLDVLADAGKDGSVEITLNSIEMLKGSELAPAEVTITAENATITAGETPNFNVALKDADEATIEGTVIYEYLKADGTYAAGLPTEAGEYTVRLYYMGTREYNYSRSTTVTLTINAA